MAVGKFADTAVAGTVVVGIVAAGTAVGTEADTVSDIASVAAVVEVVESEFLAVVGFENTWVGIVVEVVEQQL